MSITFDLDLRTSIIALTSVGDPIAQRSSTDGLLDLRFQARRMLDDLCGASETASRTTHEILDAIDQGSPSVKWTRLLDDRVRRVRRRHCTIPGLSAAGLEFTSAVRSALMVRP